MNFRFLFGFYPSTEKYNNEQDTLMSELERLKQIPESESFMEMVELQKKVHSPEFLARKKSIEAEKYKNSEEVRLELQLANLKKTKTIKSYLKGDSIENEALKVEIERYKELDAKINSAEFIERKNYLLLSPAKKFEQSEEYQIIKRYEELANSDDVKFYFKNKDSKKYDETKKWNLTFSDDFSDTLDKKKWITKYYSGEKILNDTYALAGDKHFFTERNVEVKHKVCTISTKREKITGKAWDTQFGFMQKEFDFTSGIINTSTAFKQKFGKIEAKICFNASNGVAHGFWMAGEKIVPLIDIARIAKNLTFSNVWGIKGEKPEKKTSKMPAGKFQNNYFVYCLEWSPGKLIWKINGVTVAAHNGGVPDEPMYLAFSSVVTDSSASGASMNIDWVRCFERN